MTTRWLFALLLLPGCSGITTPICVPCRENNGWTSSGYYGFQWRQSGDALTHCVPCEKAHSPAEHFVCEGGKP